MSLLQGENCEFILKNPYIVSCSLPKFLVLIFCLWQSTAAQDDLFCSNPPEVFKTWLKYDVERKTAFYSCRSGFITTGGSEIKRCNPVKGTWEGDDLICTASPCPIPPEIMGAKWELMEGGTEVRYTCNFGYQSIGGMERKQCVDGTEWSDDPDLICFPMDCGKPFRVIPFARVYYNSTTFGSPALYRCMANDKYVVRMCGVAGIWYGRSLHCPATPQYRYPERMIHTPLLGGLSADSGQNLRSSLSWLALSCGQAVTITSVLLLSSL